MQEITGRADRRDDFSLHIYIYLLYPSLSIQAYLADTLTKDLFEYQTFNARKQNVNISEITNIVCTCYVLNIFSKISIEKKKTAGFIRLA